eukprot:CAMPEP_0117054920 /NCGR_PEP_ID=MMETSP0472-20121206/38059_1 /TAXON_ID=693140 ORGANISM="Tiarina fusus, Strain LIS" /NCGR_SAMPLE_ID=MMETSP0472 /ASSEMBLY_ACC=CAM_ASM_000603 /LENGTH=309 /DNA_ID=CAMNT_0004770689 /DNA_START=229 /DNA_END=1158 /DNA_ORIENTATION=-
MPGPCGKRAPYGKRGLNEGVLATTNGVLDDIIGLSPFGIYCQSCKTKIAFSTFKNHIRDAHSECFTPQAVNYAAVSREYERLVAERKEACRDFLQFVTGEACDRFQCTSCECLFDNKSNAKRHFLSMKTGCSDASLTIVKCRKTICYRAVTLKELDRLVEEAKRKSAVEEAEDNGMEEGPEEVAVKQEEAPEAGVVEDEKPEEAAAEAPSEQEEKALEPVVSASGTSTGSAAKKKKRSKSAKKADSKEKKKPAECSTENGAPDETEVKEEEIVVKHEPVEDIEKDPKKNVAKPPSATRSSARLRKRRRY